MFSYFTKLSSYYNSKKLKCRMLKYFMLCVSFKFMLGMVRSKINHLLYLNYDQDSLDFRHKTIVLGNKTIKKLKSAFIFNFKTCYFTVTLWLICSSDFCHDKS
jgi:hypothetical protein